MDKGVVSKKFYKKYNIYMKAMKKNMSMNKNDLTSGRQDASSPRTQFAEASK